MGYNLIFLRQRSLWGINFWVRGRPIMQTVFFSHMLGKLFYPFVCWLRNRHLSTAIQKQMFVSRNERQKSLGDTHLNSCLNLFKCFLTT